MSKYSAKDKISKKLEDSIAKPMLLLPRRTTLPRMR